MKKLITSFWFIAIAMPCFTQQKIKDTGYLQPVEVLAIRAGDKAPFAKTTINKIEISKNNTGQDLPFLLNQTPNVVVNSDAGNGVGYTGIRIRGTDASRINVTLNGIPYNDAESQGTFFVDLPDFSSSINSIQIQRGVGTSSNGSGAFGASINMNTNDINEKFYFNVNNSYGSFNTLKNTLQLGTGILAKHFTFDGRLSNISSNGYIDRARSKLQSYYTSLAYLNHKTSLRLNVFSGFEKTYQAWNGVPSWFLDSARTYNSSGTEKPGTPYGNEIDHYIQSHYQLFYDQKINRFLKTNITVFYTKGKGYYEEYKFNNRLQDYGLPNYFDGINTITKTDLIRRQWLDNDFYGTVFSAQYQKNKTNLTFGGNATNYNGKHFGEIIWAQIQAAVPTNFIWYNTIANKNDFSFYSKWIQMLNAKWQTFIDMQYKNVNYLINGFKDNPTLMIHKKYNFFNPKIGITYTYKGLQAYASFAMAGKEPNRDDFEASITQLPKAEYLNDWELGIEKHHKKYFLAANIYYMQYKNQLVLTGKINDVGAYTRTNVPASYRAGIEFQGKINFNPRINWGANLSFSKNKIKNLTNYIDDYDNGNQVATFFKNTNITLSPSTVLNSSLNIVPIKNAEINLVTKYVSKQYLDNTSTNSKSLADYTLQDIRFSYAFHFAKIKNMECIVQLNNIFNKKYEPTGYTYSYIYGGNLNTENYFFPMAGFNAMVAINVKF